MNVTLSQKTTVLMTKNMKQVLLGSTSSRPTIPISASTIPHVGLKATINCIIVLKIWIPILSSLRSFTKSFINKENRVTDIESPCRTPLHTWKKSLRISLIFIHNSVLFNKLLIAK